MQMRLKRLLGFGRLTLAQQFMLASFIVLIASMLGLGWWVGQQIEIGVINRTSGETALYVDSFVDPPLQELDKGMPLSPEHVTTLNRLVQETPLGQHIVAFKVWDTKGRILYSTNPALVGQVYPIKEELARAIDGEVVSDISDLRDAENLLERAKWKRLLETYSPVTKDSTTQVIAVVEFYQTVDTLEKETRKAQLSSWLLLGGATLVIYLLLSVFVQRASNTIERQRDALSIQVSQLTNLLAQNQELHERVSRAASRATALNERFLRRIGAELHDGPAQDLGLSLLKLDSVIAGAEGCPVTLADGRLAGEELQAIQGSLQHALQEVRAISAGLSVPELEALTLSETLGRAVRAHERRTRTQVVVTDDSLPEQATLPIKIALYRLVQEALNNAYRHAGGVGQQIDARCVENNLNITVLDQGPGFQVTHLDHADMHLGLFGMRERVESLGGLFHVVSEPGQGTRISARIPLQAVNGHDE